MMPAHTIPSLSGTCRKRCKPALKPNLRQEPSSPSHSNARRERQCIHEQIDDDMNQGQRTTRNIRKPGDVGNLNFCTFTQNCNGLTS
jgi:hypothetical protein